MDNIPQFKNEVVKDEMVEEAVGSSEDHEDDIHLLLQAHNSTLASPSVLQQETSESHDITDGHVEEILPDHSDSKNHVSAELCAEDQVTSSVNPSIVDMDTMSKLDIVALQPSQIQPMFQIMGSVREGTSYVLADGQLVPATCSDESQQIQSVTLPSGMAALISDNKESTGLEGHAVQLEDGTTAIVQNLNKENSLGNKILEGQVIQLEDGTTGLIQSGLPGNDGVQSVQLEDGSTAYISLFGAGAGALNIDGNSHAQAISQAIEIASGPQRQVIVPEPTSITLNTGIDSGPISSKPLSSNNASQPHVSEKAIALGDKAYKCPYEGCKRLYTTHHHLKVHERSHTGDKPFRCEFPSCGKAFPTGYGLKSHTRVHTGEKPYRCGSQGCTKAFKTSGDLQKHIRTHTGERPFPCPFEGCDRSFTTSNIRKVHIRTHTGERPYVCNEEGCGKSFASATNYKNHIRIHTGEKPYVCTVEGCGKRFTEYSSLYKHHVVHTQSKPYVCNHCNKTYRQTSTLAMHKRTIHNDHDMSLDPEDALLGTVGGVQIMHPVEADNPADRDQEMTEGDGALVINTSDASLIANGNGQSDGTSMLTTLQTVPRGSSALLQHLQTSGLGVQTGVPVQQVYLITDSNQLETIKNLASQHQSSESSTEGARAVSGTASGTTSSATLPTADQLLDGAVTVVSASGDQTMLKYT